MEEKIQKQNVSNAGEYYVAARLSALDFTVTVTLGRAEKYDILACKNSNGKVYKFSVKTTQLENAKKFMLSVKDEDGESDDFYYVFVRLSKDFSKEPDFWIIPSKIVCRLIKEASKKWMDGSGRNGKKHSDTLKLRSLPIELTRGDVGYYEEGWAEKVKNTIKILRT